jgi:NDP-sugar pyrophosphorylase family protein
MESPVLGIIPLGGNATRMKNIPKFLLPCKDGMSLLDHCVEIFRNNEIFHIFAGVSKINHFLLENYPFLEKVLMETKTMAETVFQLTIQMNQSFDVFTSILIMPDTYFQLKQELAEMKAMLNSKFKIVVILWKIKDYQIGKVGQCKIENNRVIEVKDKDPTCQYPYFWGVIGWNSTMNKHIQPEWETIGDLIKNAIDLNIPVGAIVCEGDYYDCGTYKEYFTMIKNKT